MLTTSPELVGAIYFFLFVIGLTLPRVKIPVIVTVALSWVYWLFSDYSAILKLISTTDKHYVVLAFLIMLSFLIRKTKIDKLLGLVTIVIPLCLQILSQSHILSVFFSVAILIFYLLFSLFHKNIIEFQNNFKLAAFALVALTIFGAFYSISFSSEIIGNGYVIYQLPAIVTFLTAILLYITFIVFLCEKSFYTSGEIAQEALIIMPTILFKLVVISQSLFVLLDVPLQERLIADIKWPYFAVMLVLGMACFRCTSLEEFTKLSLMSLSAITLGIVVVEPTTTIYLPLYLVLALMIMQHLISGSEQLLSFRVFRKWSLFCLSALPTTAIPFCLIILVRVYLSEGLEIISTAIVINIGFLVASGIILSQRLSGDKESPEGNMKLPIRTLFLFSCTLLSTCLLVFL